MIWSILTSTQIACRFEARRQIGRFQSQCQDTITERFGPSPKVQAFSLPLFDEASFEFTLDRQLPH